MPGLSLASTTNADFWKPGQLVNIGGIERAWRHQGKTVAKTALRAIGAAFHGQKLRYVGTIFPGVAAVCADELKQAGLGSTKWAAFVEMLARKSQADWRSMIYAEHAAVMTDSRRAAAERTLRRAWVDVRNRPAPGTKTASLLPAPQQRALPTPEPTALKFKGDKAWCQQCDMMISRSAAEGCKSRFCSLKVAA